uniref:Copper transport protein n=1 Tax=Culicoides sonorensis TaxID=179676 RepID=A0A336K857_CULSO
MMHMSFWFGYDIGDFFFKGLVIDSTGKLIVLCAILMILSICFEAMKVHNAQTRAKAARELKTGRVMSETTSDSPLLNLQPENPNNSRPCLNKTLKGLKEAAFFLIHNALGYALMLTVMIYNGYLFIAVVAGMTIGYLLFGHISMKINMENVRAVQSKVVCNTSCPDGASIASTLPSVSEQPLRHGEGSSHHQC